MSSVVDTVSYSPVVLSDLLPRSFQHNSILHLLNHRQILCQPIRIPHNSQHILSRPRQRPPHRLVLLFPRSVLADDLAGGKFDEDTRIAYAKDDIVEAHEEAGEEQQAGGHDAHLDGEHGDAVVGELVFVEHDIVEEVDGIGALQEGQRDGGGGWGEGRGGGHGAAVVGTVGPVEGLDDFFDVFELFLSGR